MMSDTPSPKNSSWKKRFLILFLSLVILSGLCMAALPSFVSSEWGRNKIVGWINKAIPGKVKVDSISIGWIGPQSLTGLSLTDPEGNEVISLDQIHVDASLFKALLSPLSATVIEFSGLNTFLTTDKNGTTNLARALDKSCCKIIPDATGHRPVKAALTDAQGKLNLSADHRTLSLTLDGKTREGENEGTFSFVANVGGVDPHALFSGKDLSQLLGEGHAEVKVQGDIVNFPVEVIDQIVSLRMPEYAGLIKELLGNSLNMSIKQISAAGGTKLEITGSSPTLSLNGEATVQKQVTLSRPLTLKLQLSQALFDRIAALSGNGGTWKLLSPTSAQLVISRFEVPDNFVIDDLETQDLKPIGIEAAFDLAPASLSLDGGKTTASISQLHAEVKSNAGDPQATVTVQGAAQQQGQPIKINLNASVPKMLSREGWQSLLKSGLSVQGNLSGAAVPFYEGLSGKDTLTKLLGNDLNLNFAVKQVAEHIEASVAFKTPTMQLPEAALVIDDKIRLVKPVSLTLVAEPSLLQQVVDGLNIGLQGPVQARVDLAAMSVPISALGYLDTSPMVLAYKMLFDAKVHIESIGLTELPMMGDVALNHIVLGIDAEPKKRPEVSLSFAIAPHPTSPVADIFGRSGTFKTYASLGINLSGQPSINVFNLQLLSDKARLEMSGEMREGNQLVLNTPSLFTYTLTNSGMQALGLPFESYLFDHETPLEFTIDSSHIPMAWNDLSKLRLSGKLKIDDLQLFKNAQPAMHIASLDNLKADWTIDGSDERFGIDFSGLTKLGESEAAGRIDGAIVVDRWIQGGKIDLSNAILRIDTIASKLPTELLAVFTGWDDLVPVIGNALDINIKGNAPLGSNAPGNVSLAVESEHLQGGLSLVLGDAITLNPQRPADFALNVTPQGYAVLRNRLNQGFKGDFALLESTTAHLRLQSLTIPKHGSIFEGGLEGTFDLGSLTGSDPRTKQRFTLNGVKGSLKSTRLADSISFAMNGSGNTTSSDTSSWKVAGTLDNGFTPDGAVNTQDLSLSLDATFESLPVSLMCQFACVDSSIRQKIEAMIGPRLNAAVKANLRRMNGPLYVDVNGDNGTLRLDALLQEGYLYLNNDLTAQLKVTKELGKYVLEDLIPVVSGMLWAEQPITLTVSKQGFALPLRSPSLENMSIGRAVFNMGKVTFSGDSQMAKVLSLLVPTSADNVIVWLTPAYFSLNQGVVKLERVDMLISDRYPIAAWGDADIGRDKVNMVIGLSGAAIRKAFNIGGIPNGYFLQLPLKGKLHNPSIDKAKAAGKISALVAQSQGGPQGLVLGTVLDIATGGLSEPALPPPTTDPLPWANMMQEDAASSSSGDKKKGDSKKNNPIEEIGKGASSLLKKILK